MFQVVVIVVMVIVMIISNTFGSISLLVSDIASKSLIHEYQMIYQMI